ncbi:hypothetical protein COLO4_06033 [Corchorus olitorius]|uniref:Uncharacterized protein n=1 Tax=Corchorus olitorius TaxID=93759 RepID=A0A1R3KP74_9ROSI|nr:hypothetical protein COLO4_06033 [Corchorus olitorius]
MAVLEQKTFSFKVWLEKKTLSWHSDDSCC